MAGVESKTNLNIRKNRRNNIQPQIENQDKLVGDK